jgi:transposase-like protein
MRADGSGGFARNPRLSALWRADPSTAAAEVRRALEECATVEAAADALSIPPRTLYRWISIKKQLRHQRGPMKPRELAGAINRAKNVYVYVHYNPVNAFFTKISKEAARELVDDAREEQAEVEATIRDGELYIGHVPPGEVGPGESEEPDHEDEEEENNDDE